MEISRCNLRPAAALLILAPSLLIPLKLWSATANEQKVNSTITQVTVFINQAQVTRIARISLPAGTTTLVFDKLSPFINVNSIQVRTDASLTLMSVSQRTDFLKDEEKPHFVKDLEDSLQSVRWMLESITNRKQAIQFEREVMAANKAIGGSQTGLKADELEDALTLFRKRVNELNDEGMKLNQHERKLNDIARRLEQQLNDYHAGQNEQAPDVLVSIKTLAAVSNATIELTYLVTNAGWQPFYDIRVKDIHSPLQLVSKAYLTQHTGEDWKNVTIRLSTSNPNEGGTKPELQTDYIRFYTPPAPQAVTQFRPPQTMKMKSNRAETAIVEGELASSDGIATVNQSAVSIEFNVTSAYSIPSDNNPHQVDLTANSLSAVYAYGAVPKVDKDVFVTAKVSGNDLVNQVSGEANIYFDGTFVGKTFINGSTNDSMLISLGRDKRIQVQRMKLKDFSSHSFTGSTKKELSTWEISIRNTRKEAITVVLEDQVPVSTDKEIEVKLLSGGGAAFDEATGKLKWTLQLEPEQSQSLRFSFEIRYPKDKIISGY